MFVVALWSHLWENCLYINYSLLRLSPSFLSLPLSLSLYHCPLVLELLAFHECFSKYLTVEIVGLQPQSSFHSPTPKQFASIIIYVQMSHQHYRTGFWAQGSVTASKKICLSIEPRGFPQDVHPKGKGKHICVLYWVMLNVPKQICDEPIKVAPCKQQH